MTLHTATAVIAVAAAVAAIATASPSASHVSSTTASRLATSITVTAGKPSEFAFHLSARTFPAGTVVFKVTNRGKLTHDFELCLKPTAHASANSCKGKVTRKLRPGQSGTLKVVIPKKGSYEYLCTITGHAAAGMKGLLTVKPAPSAAKSGASGTSTTAQVAAGKTLFHSSGCGSCHVLKAAGTHGAAGPDLDTIKPSLARIVAQITQGGRFMPAFGTANGGNLSATQIKQVAAFVYASEH